MTKRSRAFVLTLYVAGATADPGTPHHSVCSFDEDPTEHLPSLLPRALSGGLRMGLVFDRATLRKGNGPEVEIELPKDSVSALRSMESVAALPNPDDFVLKFYFSSAPPCSRTGQTPDCLEICCHSDPTDSLAEVVPVTIAQLRADRITVSRATLRRGELGVETEVPLQVH